MRMKRTALALAGGAALALSTLVVGGGAAMAAGSATNVNVCSQVNLTGYSACLTQNIVVNKNWTIADSTLTVTGSYGWVSTFTFEQKTPMRAGITGFSSGTVTDTTEYGTSTEAFMAAAGATTPFGLAPAGGYTLINGTTVPAGNIWADNGSYYYLPTTSYGGYSMLAAQIDLVYNQGGQNAGYWFGT